jgi:xanthine dehydrogenase YagS FAD-binding subunit
MRPFSYARAADLAQAVHLGQHTGQGQTDAPVQFLAGGTTLHDLMKLDVMVPERLVDLTPLRATHAAVTPTAAGLRLGALARMAHVAAHPAVRSDYPVLAQSLQLAASAQLRNMATLGGNVLQRTRCTYFRDPSWTACNKRTPGSGCAALTGFNRNHAVLGTDASCIAQYPGDFAVALMALEAEIDLTGPQGSRKLPIASLHRAAEGQPHLENNLRPGEVITAFFIPATSWAQRSAYVKVRDRASYEFAIGCRGTRVGRRCGSAGPHRPWRHGLPSVARSVCGSSADRQAAHRDLGGCCRTGRDRGCRRAWPQRLQARAGPPDGGACPDGGQGNANPQQEGLT